MGIHVFMYVIRREGRVMCELLFYRRAWLIAFIWETERLTCSETGEWALFTAQSPTSGVYISICFSGTHNLCISKHATKPVSRCIFSVNEYILV